MLVRLQLYFCETATLLNQHMHRQFLMTLMTSQQIFLGKESAHQHLSRRMLQPGSR